MQQQQRNVSILESLNAEIRSGRRDLEAARKIHGRSIQSGCDSSIYVASKLVQLYAQCGSLADAKSVFDRVDRPDTVLWNVLISAYARNGQPAAALALFFDTMPERGSHPDCRTVAAALTACAARAASDEATETVNCRLKLQSLVEGKRIHAYAVENGWEQNIYVANTLMEMYVKCGSLTDAKEVFEKTRRKDVVSWNTLLAAVAVNGDLSMFETMISHQGQFCEPNARSFVAALKSCAVLAAGEEEVHGGATKMRSLEKVMAIHALAVQRGCDSDSFLANTLMDVYAKCGSMIDSKAVFDRLKRPDIVSWNVIMSGYVDNELEVLGEH